MPVYTVTFYAIFVVAVSLNFLLYDCFVLQIRLYTLPKGYTFSGVDLASPTALHVTSNRELFLGTSVLTDFMSRLKLSGLHGVCG